MNNSYYIQRGFVRQVENESKIGFDKIAEFDYMGSAEFEWGALPRGLRRMCMNIKEYKEVTVVIRGIEFRILCRESMLDEVIDELSKLMDGSIRLKEYSKLTDVSKLNQDEIRTNLWWSLDNNYIVALRKLPEGKLINALGETYHNWYLKQSDKDKSKFRLHG